MSGSLEQSPDLLGHGPHFQIRHARQLAKTAISALNVISSHERYCHALHHRIPGRDRESATHPEFIGDRSNIPMSSGTDA